MSCANKSTPTKKWIDETCKLIDLIGREEYILKCGEWISFCSESLKRIHKDKSYKDYYLMDVNHSFLKGLIWTCSILNDNELNIIIDDYCLQAYKKYPDVGSISERTGNACLYCFYMLPLKEGIARLTKFRMKIKYPSILKIINKYINLVAERENCSQDEIEEIAIPDFGIDDQGILKKQFDDYQAVYQINGVNSASLSWQSDGKKQKSIPVEIKERHAGDLKLFKNQIKEIETLLSVQKDRIEQFYLKCREWNLKDWMEYYIKHPLVSITAKKLIWEFENGDKKEEGIFFKNKIVNIDKQEIDWINDKTKVRLWHPLGINPERVLEWRNFMQNERITQPFKQAYREIYILTEAEFETETYSNRFASHILRQHQFSALCKQKGWIYTLQGQWDSFNTPFIELPFWNIKAEFFVEACHNSTASGTGVYNYVSTDQVRFYKNKEVMKINEVPRPVFSEIMRTVDMFVGVTSIGNDPNWQDTGDGNYNNYWQGYSFGVLSESSITRSIILKNLIPKLKIADRCSFDDRYLIVKGDIRTYKIHMGSGNILMLPNDQYLCIVAKNDISMDKIFLPFEGDNLLSIIISKAFMLADDTGITDKTIVSQLKKWLFFEKNG
jgi:hypothetical protein